MHRDFPCRRHTQTISLLPIHNRRADDSLRCKPQLETLESRHLMTAENGIDWAALLSTNGQCNCSLCTGQGLNSLAAAETVTGTGGGLALAGSPLSSLPQLSSNPNATAKLYLDFNGNTQASWGGYTNVVTKVFDTDGDQTTFSTSELNAITEIWRRVAEDYAPFNIDVTTIATGNQTNGVTAHIAIGGNYSDWFGQSAGGVAYIGGFYNGASNVGYVFEDALGNGNARYVAEAVSHEAGHLFGLLHQAEWNGNELVAGYSQGTAAWAPIMGVGYYSQRTTFHNGPTDDGPTAYQDDMSILANNLNNFGYKADDFGSSLATAAALAATAGSVNFAGLIGTNSDQDWFTFTTEGGALNLTVNVATIGANLDSVLELRDAAGLVITTASPTNSFNATISTTLASGTYFVVVRSSGGYGNVGQYTLVGTAPIGTQGGGGGGAGEDTSVPEINVLNGTTAIQSGGSVSFGSVQVGNSVNKTLTVRNSGTGPLTLTPLSYDDLPAGWSIVTNFASTTLAAGASATITLRFTPTVAGAASGVLMLVSDDADEGSFAINLTGSATPAPAPEITVLNGTTNVLAGGTINWGSVQVTKNVTKTITVKNTGNATLTLVKPTAGDLPAGFTIVTNFASTSLAAGASATISIRYTPTVVGAAGGVLNLVSNDADEGTFAINLTGTGTPGPSPEINVNVGTLAVQTGGTVDFGNVQVGKYVNKVITIKNTGTATLTLVKPTALQMPAGFTIVTNFATTSLAAGASASITLRYTAAALGATGGVLNLISNDSDEGTFSLNLTGTGTPAPIIKAIDNGAAGFTTTGTWTRITYQGREADIQVAAKGTGTTTATWTFTALPPGQYRVHASWTGSSLNATNAPFTIYDGSTAVGTVLKNQEVAASGLSWSSTNWSSLGTFDITGDTIRVTLTNAANDRVVADAVRVERIGDLPEPGGAAAAGSALNLGLLDQASSLQPAVSTPASSSPSSAPLFAPLTTSISLTSSSGLTSESVDEVLTSNNETRAELMLLDQSLDLLRTVENTIADGSGSDAIEATDELLAEDWLSSEGFSM